MWGGYELIVKPQLSLYSTLTLFCCVPSYILHNTMYRPVHSPLQNIKHHSILSTFINITTPNILQGHKSHTCCLALFWFHQIKFYLHSPKSQFTNHLTGLWQTVQMWHPLTSDLWTGWGNTYKTLKRENKKPEEEPQRRILLPGPVHHGMFPQQPEPMVA